MPVMSSWARLITSDGVDGVINVWTVVHMGNSVGGLTSDGVLDFACLYVVLELKSTSFFFACQHFIYDFFTFFRLIRCSIT